MFYGNVGMPAGEERLCRGGWILVGYWSEGVVEYAAGMVSVGVTYARRTFHDNRFRHANNI